jgi:RimJ/RimL family protein N-acetyltransferase
MRSIRLRDGRAFCVRPIHDDDEERLSDAFDRLSPDSKYKRFLALKPHLTDHDVNYLVHVDAQDHVALIAADPAEPDVIIAVARFVRLESDPTVAEFSIVVGDEYQGAGLGAALMQLLADDARAVGIDRFVATILAENIGAHRLVQAIAPSAPRWISHGTVDEVEIDLGLRSARAVEADSTDRRPGQAFAIR